MRRTDLTLALNELSYLADFVANLLNILNISWNWMFSDLIAQVHYSNKLSNLYIFLFMYVFNILIFVRSILKWTYYFNKWKYL